ncbi:MAG: glycyl-radical enzyme activating protein [Selenomonadaceae bacterium]|nr:glycyl-radical enzyme activating protein [Selenomonadaceae bacterium]
MVFNIQRYSVHDGPGIRTVVFLKGCPLRCRWCSNPESQAAYPELSFHRRSCLGYSACGLCSSLMTGCDDEDKPVFPAWPERQADAVVRSCANGCPAKALNIYGRKMPVQEVLQEAEKDLPFYRRSGGGLTLSGGGVLAQPEFAEAILSEARKLHIHTAAETCGCGDWQVLKKLAGLLDYIMYDVKCLDEKLHIRGTGGSNRQILENLSDLAEGFPKLPILVRTPVIPGFNDDAG